MLEEVCYGSVADCDVTDIGTVKQREDLQNMKIIMLEDHIPLKIIVYLEYLELHRRICVECKKWP